MSESNWNIRDANESDLAFIYDSWSISLLQDAHTYRGCRPKVFFPRFHALLDWILSGPDTQVKVACHLDYPNTVFGESVYEPNIIHFVFVKWEFQRFGIGKSLWEAAGSLKTFTHRTKNLGQILLKRDQTLYTYNPFLLFQQLGDQYGRKTKDVSEISSAGLPNRDDWQQSDHQFERGGNPGV